MYPYVPLSVAICWVCQFPHLYHGMLCDDISQYYFHWEVFGSVAQVTKGCGMLVNMMMQWHAWNAIHSLPI